MKFSHVKVPVHDSWEWLRNVGNCNSLKHMYRRVCGSMDKPVFIQCNNNYLFEWDSLTNLSESFFKHFTIADIYGFRDKQTAVKVGGSWKLFKHRFRRSVEWFRLLRYECYSSTGEGDLWYGSGLLGHWNNFVLIQEICGMVQVC